MRHSRRVTLSAVLAFGVIAVSGCGGNQDRVALPQLQTTTAPPVRTAPEPPPADVEKADVRSKRSDERSNATSRSAKTTRKANGADASSNRKRLPGAGTGKQTSKSSRANTKPGFGEGESKAADEPEAGSLPGDG